MIKTCRESPIIISVSSILESPIAKLDFPTAVRPETKINFLFIEYLNHSAC